MKTYFASVFLGFLLCAGSALAQEASLPPDLEKLVEKINTKLEGGKPSESALKEEMAEFDKLLAQYKDNPEHAATTLFLKGTLYFSVLNDTAKGTEILKQIQKEYPNTSIRKNADRALAAMERMQQAEKVQASLAEGKKFPDFQVKDLQGKPLSLADYKGKVLLIDFWATWCGPCIQELPNVKAAYDKYHDKGFEILGISLDQDEGKLKEFIKNKDMPWRQYFDGKGWENELATKYGVNSIPDTYLLDGEGKIIGRKLRGAELEKAVAKALEAKK